jgi:hypothetical protein
MTSILTNEEKIAIIDQHIRGLDYSIYGAQLDKIEAEAVSLVDTDLIASLDEKLENLNDKRAALVSEKSVLA